MGKSKTVTIIVAVVLIALMVAGCGGSGGGTSSSGSGSSGGSGSGDDGRVYELNVNLPYSEDHGPGTVQAMKNCEERSNGRLKFTAYWSNSLLNIREMPKGYQDGLADVGPVPLAMYSDQLPLNAVIACEPFMGYKDRDQAWAIFNQIHEEFPEMDQELLELGMTPVGYYPLTAYQLHFVYDNKEVRLPSDIRGNKIITSQLELSEFLSSVDVAPIDQPIMEFFGSLEKGVADGVWNNYAIVHDMGLIPLVKQHTSFGETGSHLAFNIFVIRSATLESLPDDLRQIMIEEWSQAAVAQGREELAADEKSLADCQAEGHLFIDLTAEEIEQWAAPVRPLVEAQIAKLADRKPIATDVYNRIKELIEIL